jgi:hypothetical protein
MGVTAIKYFLNQSPQEVDVINHRNRRRYEGIASGQSRSMDEWVPWARSAAEFDGGEYIEVRLKLPNQEDVVYAIWQRDVGGDGDFIRFSQRNEVAGWDDPGAHVPGSSEVNGNRVLRLLGDNSLLLEWSG